VLWSKPLEDTLLLDSVKWNEDEDEDDMITSRDESFEPSHSCTMDIGARIPYYEI